MRRAPPVAKGKIKIDLAGAPGKVGKSGLHEIGLRDLRDVVEKQNGRPRAFSEQMGNMLQVELRDDHLHSTLRKYIENLGGELEINARFGDQRVRLKFSS